LMGHDERRDGFFFTGISFQRNRIHLQSASDP
jgi:hypothetical protein